MIKYLRAACIALAAIVYSSLAMAQAPCQWNYYFDGSGNAHASYCGTIDWSTSSTVPLAAITGLGTSVATALGNPLDGTGGLASHSALLAVGISSLVYATGNGTTDDTAALQNWIAAAYAAKTPAYCAPGTYKITKSLNLTGPSIKIFGPGGSGCNITPAFGAPPTVSGTASGATYGSTPSIRLTVSSTATIGAAIQVAGIVGTTEANGVWPTAVIDGTHVDVIGPTYVHAWTSGGYIALPVFATNPVQVTGLEDPEVDIEGLFFNTPSANPNVTDVAIFTNSQVVFKFNVANGYGRGLQFSLSYAPYIENNYFYNGSGSAVRADQDVSFNNAHVLYNKTLSNGGTGLEAAYVIGGANWVENPSFIGNEGSGNHGGIQFTNVQGAIVQGNYLENNTPFNFYCTGTASVGTQFIGNWINISTPTETTNMSGCTNSTYSGNWLNNEVWNVDANASVGANVFGGTGAINLPTTTPTPTCTSGSPTTAASSITMNSLGKTKFVTTYVTITTVGTCSGYVQVALPFTPAIESNLTCREDGVSGKSAVMKMSPGSAIGTIYAYDNTSLVAAGAGFYCSGIATSQ